MDVWLLLQSLDTRLSGAALLTILLQRQLSIESCSILIHSPCHTLNQKTTGARFYAATGCSNKICISKSSSTSCLKLRPQYDTAPNYTSLYHTSLQVKAVFLSVYNHHPPIKFLCHIWGLNFLNFHISSVTSQTLAHPSSAH